jgi:hypothetical protein
MRSRGMRCAFPAYACFGTPHSTLSEGPAPMLELRWRSPQKALVHPPRRCLLTNLRPRASTLKHS